MKKEFHIIITGENCKTRSLVVKKSTVRASVLGGLLLSLLLVVTVNFSLHSLEKDDLLQQKLTQLQDQLARTTTENGDLLAQVTRQKDEKKVLLSNAINELNQRSSQIESILTKVGVKVVEDSTSESKGGPYIPLASDNPEDVLSFSEKMIEIIEQLPLGRPVGGRITSGYGKRRDPFNGKAAFHSGIDISNRSGTKILATAIGKVVKCGYENGYGKMVTISHDNGFSTKFGHLKKILVKKGDLVQRGDAIGTMGNTGRSLGTHLHYEILKNDQSINPKNLMLFAKKIIGESMFPFSSSGSGKEAISTVLGKETAITGDVSFKGIMRMDGLISGNVSGEHLIISESGKVVGDVTSQICICHGQIVGNLISDKLQVKKGGRIDGTINTEDLAVESGSVLNGEVNPQKQELRLISGAASEDKVKTPAASTG